MEGGDTDMGEARRRKLAGDTTLLKPKKAKRKTKPFIFFGFNLGLLGDMRSFVRRI